MIYEFLAEGFEEVEALTPLDLLRRSGAHVVTVCVSPDGDEIAVTGAHGITVKADISAKEAAGLLSRGDLEMIILPGGMPGTKNLDASELVHDFITKAAEEGAYISAICAAPMILGKRGLLDGKRATCFPGFEEYLAKSAVGGRVAVDGQFITSCGMGAALEFGLALVSALKGEETASALGKAVLA
ncbi:MAG: DJ-1/PfpI family protein [Ruminococcaceae bacterium]|nr:DJ-1/PfpI family protein [Oscillospiraceae bacterium]